MKRVLIVDDDALVRMFLRQIIAWDEQGYEIAGEARDGEEALVLAAEHKPDLCLIDVSMPTMNGIELIRNLKARAFSGGIIVLTCHDDFEYVKTAMQLGADEYILKNHLNAEVLMSALASTADSAATRTLQIEKEGQLFELAQKGLLEKRKEVLQSLLQQTSITTQAQKELLQSVGISEGFGHCYAVIARAEEEFGDLLDSVCELVAAEHGYAAIRLRGNAVAFFLDVTQYPSSSVQSEKITALCDALATAAERELHLPLCFGASGLCIGAGAIAKAVRQADDALMFFFYRDGLFSFADVSLLKADCPMQAECFLTRLPVLLQGDQEALKTEISQVIHSFEMHLSVPGAVIAWLQRCDRIAGMQRTQAQYAALVKLSRVSESLLEYQGFLPSYQVEHNDMEHSPAVEEALRYIRANFSKVCTLGEVAEHVGLSPNYLSAQFKQETKLGFVEYLTNLRLTHVQSLMQYERWDTLKSLALRSGFSDYQHFCKVFKRKTGLSPAAYRQSLQHTP